MVIHDTMHACIPEEMLFFLIELQIQAFGANYGMN